MLPFSVMFSAPTALRVAEELGTVLSLRRFQDDRVMRDTEQRARSDDVSQHRCRANRA